MTLYRAVSRLPSAIGSTARSIGFGGCCLPTSLCQGVAPTYNAVSRIVQARTSAQ